MKAVVFHGREDLRIQSIPTPKVQSSQALVRVRRVGICGSDMHYYAHGRAGSFVPKRPFVLGHEIAGEVADVGPDADAGLVGRRVSVDPSMPCGQCVQCRRGRYNLCLNMRFLGSASTDPHIDGGFAEYVVVPARNCHAVPDEIDWGLAALAEPLSVAIHGLKRAGEIAGKSVFVTGGGPIGQLTGLAARAFGARLVVLSDIAEFPQTLAVDLGADAALNAADPSFYDKVCNQAPDGFDIVIEASGSAAAIPAAISIAGRGGTIVQVGTLHSDVTVPLNSVMARELSYLGSFRFANVFETALDLIVRKKEQMRGLISAVYPLSDAVIAMDRAIGKNEVIKIQIEA